MVWYISVKRVTVAVFYTYIGYVQANWIREAEDTYRRSLTWKPAVATLIEHKICVNKVGASHVWYEFDVDGERFVGDKFRSGGIYKEEHLVNANLLGVGTELIVYHNPGDPTESAIKLAADRGIEAFFAFNALFCAGLAFRCVRCETIFPNILYRFLNVNRRFSENTGIKQRTSSQRRPGSSFGGTPKR
jgi:hypothetical protein